MNIANIPIQEITRTNINADLSKLTNYANSTIEKIHILIGQAFNYAMLNEIINKNPFTIKGSIIRPISKKPDKEIEKVEEYLSQLH